jgi:hypothetical protein
MFPHISATHCTFFLKQDVCKTLIVDSVPGSFPTSALCQSFLVQTSVERLGLNLSLFWFHTYASRLYFLAQPKPQLSPHSTAWARNSQGTSKLVNLGWLLIVLWQLLKDFHGALHTSEVQNKMIFMGHQILSCHVPVVRSFSSCGRCCYQLKIFPMITF